VPYYPLQRVINATGVVLYIGLGRAPYGEVLLERAYGLPAGCSDLGFRLATESPGCREVSTVESLVRIVRIKTHLPK
jgi:seryl-tRNA(Sec) selenium transferase